MAKILYSLALCMCMVFCGTAFADNGFSCGDGYVLVQHSKIDGIETWECQKLWCHDLETNKPMGNGNRAASGYVETARPMELTDWTGKSITCFGDRKWCSGEPNGQWNADIGGYTRAGDDSLIYKSFQKGGCFAWRLEKPDCDAGMVAVLKNNKWECVTEYVSPNVGRAASVRRTGTIRMK